MLQNTNKSILEGRALSKSKEFEGLEANNKIINRKIKQEYQKVEQSYQLYLQRNQKATKKSNTKTS